MNQRRREGVWLCYCVTRVTGYGHGGTEAGTAPPGHSGHRTTAHLTKHYYGYTFFTWIQYTNCSVLPSLC